MSRPALERALDAGPPLELTDWALGEDELEAVLSEVERGRRTVLECGSGASTLLIARALRELGSGRLHALEHDEGFAQELGGRLAAEGLTAWATVLWAPLEPCELALDDGRWYAAAALERIPSGIELLLVDGPPGNEPHLERSRYPALGRLGSLLAPEATVLLDDAERPGERAILERWEREFALSFQPAAGGLARAVLKEPASR